MGFTFKQHIFSMLPIFFSVGYCRFENSPYAGVEIKLNPPAIDYLMRATNDIVKKNIYSKTLHIEDVIEPDYQFKNFVTNVTSFPVVNKIVFDETNRKVSLIAQGGHIRVKADFRAGKTVLFVPLYVTGTVHASASAKQMSFEVDPLLEAGMLHPVLTQCNIDLWLNIDDIRGNVWATIIGWFKSLVSTVLTPVIQASLCDIIKYEMEQNAKENLVGPTGDTLYPMDTKSLINYAIVSPLAIHQYPSTANANQSVIQALIDASIYKMDYENKHLKTYNRREGEISANIKTNRMVGVTFGQHLVQAFLDQLIEENMSQCPFRPQSLLLSNDTMSNQTDFVTVSGILERCTQASTPFSFHLSFKVLKDGMIAFNVSNVVLNFENEIYADDVHAMLNNMFKDKEVINGILFPQYVQLDNVVVFFEDNFSVTLLTDFIFYPEKMNTRIV